MPCDIWGDCFDGEDTSVTSHPAPDLYSPWFLLYKMVIYTQTSVFLIKKKELMMVLVFKIIQLLKELDDLTVIMKKALSGSHLQKPSEILVAFYFPLLNYCLRGASA